jgi:LuxR family maltose regulon positive regulatory protein
MKTPLLQTKLHIPASRPKLVSRPHLIGQLNEGLRHSQDFGHKLTLISAPAGFGKTTLVANWLHQSKVPAVWLSLDKRDNDATRFLVYLIAALQTIKTNFADELLAALQSAQPPPLEPALTILLNELTTISDNSVLVLDDYHVIEAEPVNRALAFLLEHLPPQLHLVITSREDPSLPLARLRARGQLTELRASDLRFTLTETAEFLNQVMGLSLSPAEIAALADRTEGWAASLQMAAISMQGRTDTVSFIQAFTGSHRFIIDYLAEEVLQRQSEPVRRFLVQTSFLASLSGPLCEAVTGQQNSAEMLEALERSNLFLISLDDQRQWYRYHQLFADVLRAHLAKEPASQVAVLHQRASNWYERNDSPAEAIHHALAAEDFERAATLVELAWPAIFNGFQPATWLGWAQALPEAILRVRPVLNLGCAWALLDGGQLDAVETRLRAAERWLDSSTESDKPAEDAASGRVVVNDEAFRTLPASIANARAYLAQIRGDGPATIKNAQRALDLFPEDEYYQRGIAAMFLGLATWSSGELEAAFQSIARSVASIQKSDNLYLEIPGTVFLADIKRAQGRLREAAGLYQQGLQRVGAQNAPLLQGTPDLYIGLGELARERDDLPAAVAHLLTGEKLSRQVILPGSGHRLRAAMAHLKVAEADLDSALDLLNQAERRYEQDPVPDVRPVAAVRARLWLKQDRLPEALSWAQARGLSVADDLNYLCEFEHITLARIRLAQYQHDGEAQAIRDALSLLARLLPAAEAGDRLGSVIEILVLQALAHKAQGNSIAALAPLKRALTLAEPEGYVRIFVDEGRPLQTLLAESLSRGADAGYVTHLLTAISRQTGDEPTIPDPNQLLIEPLSKRELDVLGLIALGYTNQAIADELVIALSTVKKHVNNTFGKLGVSSRTQAVSRARELGLL